MLVAIDLRRYERWVLEAADATVAARRRGDRAHRLTPLPARHRRGQVAFVVAAEGAGPFDSHVGTLALANALVTGVAARLRRPATDRLDRVESAWQAAHALTDD